MKNSVRILALVMMAVLLLSGVGCTKLKARDQLNKGVQAFKNAKYEEAIEHFNQSVALDPTLLTARLYLGTAYMQQYIPGADTPENNRSAQMAIDEFKRVLAAGNSTRETKLHALKSIASLYYNMKEFDKSTDFYRQASETDPNDPEIYYMLGVIDWADTYKTSADAKAKIGLKVDEAFKAKGKDDQKVCQQLMTSNSPKVKEGLDSLDKALKLRPEYEDAMAYMNLLYRRKADIECGNPAAHAADVKMADQWSDKTMAIRKEKAEKAQQQPAGIVMDTPKDTGK